MNSEEYKMILIGQFIDVLSEMSFAEIYDIIEKHDIQAFLERMCEYGK